MSSSSSVLEEDGGIKAAKLSTLAAKEERVGGGKLSIPLLAPLSTPRKFVISLYREVNKCLYVVALNFFLLLPNCSAWPCLAVA